MTTGGGESRERILAAATSVFAEQGFSGARVDEIAARAGINKAMLYYHVGDKAALYSAVVIANIDHVLGLVREELAATDDPAEQICGLQRAFLRGFLERPEYPQIMLRELASGGANLAREALERMAALLATTRAIVENGQARGAFRDVPPILAHLVAVGTVIFLVNAARLRERMETVLGEGLIEMPGDPTKMAEVLSDLLLNGLASRGDGR